MRWKSETTKPMPKKKIKRKPAVKRQPKKRPGKNKVAANEIALLKKALTKLPKTELVDRLLKSARLDHDLKWKWLKEFNITLPTSDLFESTIQAIDVATEVDEDQFGQNFDYSDSAYNLIKQNFKALTKDARWNEVCDLALILIKKGSYQAESSAEGLMVGDIEDCLNVIFNKIKKSTLSWEQIEKWAVKMVEHDRIGCICNAELEELCGH